MQRCSLFSRVQLFAFPCSGAVIGYLRIRLCAGFEPDQVAIKRADIVGEARFLERVHRLHTDADPASHRFRLWRGGSASKVLLLRLFLPRVHFHRRLEVRKRPWLLFLQHLGRRDSAAGGHRSFCDPVFSLFVPCKLLFFPKDVFNNLPSRAAALVPEHLIVSTSLSASYAVRRWLDFVRTEHEEPTEDIEVSILGEVFGYILAAAARSVGLTGRLRTSVCSPSWSSVGHQALHQLQFYPRRFP